MRFMFFAAGAWALLLTPSIAYAHCPLCTAGAGVAALAAVRIGVSPMAVGVFLGAAAVALGLWMGRLIKKEYLRHQTLLLAVLSWVLTIIPMRGLLADYSSVYLSFWGEFGRTVMFNLFIVGSVAGGALMLYSPALSRAVSRARHGAVLPYQGVVLTLIILTAAAAAIEYL